MCARGEADDSGLSVCFSVRLCGLAHTTCLRSVLMLRFRCLGCVGCMLPCDGMGLPVSRADQGSADADFAVWMRDKLLPAVALAVQNKVRARVPCRFGAL